MTPVSDFAALAVDAGWTFHTASKGREENQSAISIAGTRFATLVSPDGMTRVALRGELLYYHNGRVWLAMDYQPKRVTIAGVVVDKPSRRRGAGTAAMRALVDIAIRNGFTLLLEAQPIEDEQHKEKRLTRQRLIRWYSGLGFVPAYPGEGKQIMRVG